VINKLVGHHLHDIVVVDLATGIRRGELLALRLSDVDLEAATVRIERSLGETRAGLRFKTPKTTKQGHRVARAAPQAARDALGVGLGKPNADTLLFGEPDGSPTPPRRLTTRWREACVSLGLPRVSFHALPHTRPHSLRLERMW
jgi:integrase